MAAKWVQGPKEWGFWPVRNTRRNRKIIRYWLSVLETKFLFCLVDNGNGRLKRGRF